MFKFFSHSHQPLIGFSRQHLFFVDRPGTSTVPESHPYIALRSTDDRSYCRLLLAAENAKNLAQPLLAAGGILALQASGKMVHVVWESNVVTRPSWSGTS